MISTILKADFSIDPKEFKGKSFVWITLKKGSPVGELYYLDSNGKIRYSTRVTSGAAKYKTPTGKFKIYHKKRKHMSTKYPDISGRNNMNYSLFFHRGFAMHQGSVRAASHGCVHVAPGIASKLYQDCQVGTPVVITRVPHTIRTKLYRIKRNQILAGNVNLSTF